MAKHKLLLADDSITIQKVVNLTFADEGVEVVSVGDGNAALEKLAEFTPDLVMADINMPGLSGYEICRYIRQNEATSRVPVILLVGSFEPFDETEAERVGANDFLTKPFQSIRQLVTKVSGLLETAGKSSTDEIISDLETPAENKFPGEFENTLEMNKPEDSAEEFGDSGMDDEMIQTNQIGASVAEKEEDPRITQPLTTAEFDEIHQKTTEQERGYAFVGETPFDSSAETESPSQPEVSTLAETEPLPEGNSFYQTQRVINAPEAEDDANLLELPPQTQSVSAAYNSSVWQEELVPLADGADNETAETNQSAPTFNVEETTETAWSEADSEAVEKNDDMPADETVEEIQTESPVGDSEENDIRQAPTDEMIDMSEIEAAQAESSAAPAQIENLSPEVIEAIAAKVSEKFSDRVLHELIEELKPQITELIAKKIAE